MKKFLPSRRKPEDAKTEPEAAVEERAASTSTLENEIGVSDGAVAAAAAEAVAEEPVEYVEGWKLWSMLVSITSVFILVLLDMSIVATVSPVSSSITSDVEAFGRQYPKSHHGSTPCETWAGTVQRTC